MESYSYKNVIYKWDRNRWRLLAQTKTIISECGSSNVHRSPRTVSLLYIWEFISLSLLKRRTSSTASLTMVTANTKAWLTGRTMNLIESWNNGFKRQLVRSFIHRSVMDSFRSCYNRFNSPAAPSKCRDTRFSGMAQTVSKPPPRNTSWGKTWTAGIKPKIKNRQEQDNASFIS